MRGVDVVRRNRHYRCLEYDHDQKGDICLIACGMERCDPTAHYGPETRDCWHLHAVLSGRGTLRAGGQTFHPHYGQFFLLKDGETVEYWADPQDPWEYCWVTYKGTESERLSAEMGFERSVYCLDSSIDVREFYGLIQRMYEQPEMNYVNDLRRRGILLEFLALTMEATGNGKKPGQAGRGADQEYYVQCALDFIHNNFDTIAVSDIVAYIGITRSYLSRIFRARVGRTPQDYLIQYRVSRARTLLVETDMSVTEIAAKVGYENPLTFSRMFHGVCGESPMGYRGRMRQAAVPSPDEAI